MRRGAVAMVVALAAGLIVLGGKSGSLKRWVPGRAAPANLLLLSIDTLRNLEDRPRGDPLVHEARAETAQAQAPYEVELRRNPKAYRATFNLAKLLLAGGRPAEAAARFREAVGAKPDFGTGYLYLAKALLDAGDLEGALESARKGLAANPEPEVTPLGHYVLADVYSRLGRPRDAAREVAAARKLEPGG